MELAFQFVPAAPCPDTGHHRKGPERPDINSLRMGKQISHLNLIKYKTISSLNMVSKLKIKVKFQMVTLVMAEITVT